MRFILIVLMFSYCLFWMFPFVAFHALFVKRYLNRNELKKVIRQRRLLKLKQLQVYRHAVKLWMCSLQIELR